MMMAAFLGMVLEASNMPSGEAGVEEEFAVAFHAEDGRVDEGKGLAA